MDEVKTKICTKCKRELPATREYFHKHKGSKDGLNCWCKESSVLIVMMAVRLMAEYVPMRNNNDGFPIRYT
jgi:hypothetical protein